ncbi:DsbA family protein [Pontibacter diazotrophicus]|uniref:DsbA family protein n=1 Tax=Pontibacter diazotrophicus TaxID=1400979 RepID=A0A3D8LA14_9BACT|nr:DsbA family protein [Pontibacter diazotrophicus]RDV14156.1 DsbA family protein [Pontibacter diazotrophicus]
MKKSTLLYIQDALCGWCYGMSPVIQQLYKEHQQDYNFVVLSGGMIRGSNVKPISGMADYIRQASKQLEEVTGVKQTQAYHEKILDKGTYITNSEPPAIALLVLKEQFPEKQVPLAAAIQNLHFVEGKDLNEVETYLPVVRQFGASEEKFKKKFTDKDYADLARQEFDLVEKWGISGFPAVVCEAGEKLYLVAQGYQHYDQLAETLARIQQEAAEEK